MKKLQSFISLVTGCLLSCFVLSHYTIMADAYLTIQAEIPVSCLEIHDDNTHIYQIVIEPDNTISPTPKSDLLEITENGSGKFEIDIDEPGTYQYRIYEKPGYDTNIIYDDNIYSITVYVETVTDDDLRYAVSAQIIGKDEKPERIEFENTLYVDYGTVTTTLPVTTVASETTTASDTAYTTSAVVTGDVTTTTTARSENKDNPITEFIDTVLTGDSFPAHAVRSIMLFSVLVAISTFLFKRDNSEEEDKNEDEE